MSTQLIIAITAICCAFILYTVSVFAQLKAKSLQAVHVFLLWLALACDFTGTIAMTTVATAFSTGNSLGILHLITGILGIALMAVAAIYATIIMRRHNQTAQAKFPKINLIIWLIWLVPFLSGMAIGMR